MIKFIVTGATLLGTILVAQLPSLPPLPTAKVTLKVLDEDGNAISGASVGFAFLEAHPKWGAPIGAAVHTLTDATGTATASGYSGASINCGAHKDGYYDGGPSEIKFHDAVLGKWQPWNPECEVVLKKIINPIPMYAKKVRTVIPVLDQPIGFDLAAGDWVQPFGAGRISDFTFTLSRTLKDPADFTAKLLLTFTGKGDGVQVIPQVVNQGWSRLKLPRNGLEDGYASTWSTDLSHGSFGAIYQQPEGLGYFFRVRSVLQDDKVKQGLYGKIDGNISIVGAAADHPGITFTYYFNPTGTTNLEFDPSKNLFRNLSEDQEVQMP